MSRLGGHDGAHGRGFPRVSGDEPQSDILLGLQSEFSPRERG